MQWLCGEGGFAMDERVMLNAALGGNLELVQWLRGEGCPWDTFACAHASWRSQVAPGGHRSHLEILRWLRANGCPWNAGTRDLAAAMLGYTDDFGNLVPDYYF